jgi:enoyl-CoA hydratase/carnithine racemase
MTPVVAPRKTAQIRLTQRSPAYWRVTIDNPPINVMGPEMVRQFQEVINAIEADEHLRVVVFESAVDDYFLNQALSKNLTRGPFHAAFLKTTNSVLLTAMR